MRILVDINHPAHVHLFRHAIREWQSHGHQVLIAARDKDVSLALLERFGIDYNLTAGVRTGPFSFFTGVLELDWKLYRLASDFDPDVMVGTSFAIAHVSRLLRGKSVVFGEDSKAASRWFWAITQPFADAIAVPDAIVDDYGPRQFKHPSNHELAYLHPTRFKPDSAVLQEAGLDPGEPFSLVRFVSFRASHDVSQSGLGRAERRRLLELLQEHGRVLINTEGPLSAELDRFRMQVSPERLHHLLAFAQILVSDSQTMTIEAAVLGTPSVRYNSFVGRTPVIEELEEIYGLTSGFHPPDAEAMLARVEEILALSPDTSIWSERRQVLLQEKIALTDWMVAFVERIGAQDGDSNR